MGDIVEWKIKDFKYLSVEELYGILKLRNEVFVVEEEYIYNDLDEKDINAFHLYCVDNNKVIVALRILKKESEEKGIYIGRIVVDKSYRGLGLGKQSIKKAMKFIEYRYGREAIKVSTQLQTKDFYRSLGFKEISDSYLEQDIPHIKMIKNFK